MGEEVKVGVLAYGRVHALRRMSTKGRTQALVSELNHLMAYKLHWSPLSLPRVPATAAGQVWRGWGGARRGAAHVGAEPLLLHGRSARTAALPALGAGCQPTGCCPRPTHQTHPTLSRLPPTSWPARLKAAKRCLLGMRTVSCAKPVLSSCRGEGAEKGGWPLQRGTGCLNGSTPDCTRKKHVLSSALAVTLLSISLRSRSKGARGGRTFGSIMISRPCTVMTWSTVGSCRGSVCVCVCGRPPGMRSLTSRWAPLPGASYRP